MKNRCCLSFRAKPKLSFSSRDIIPLPVNYLYRPWLEARYGIRWSIHLVNLSVLNFICLTSDESIFLESRFARLPRHGLGFKHIKNQNDDEKEHELRNVLKVLWMVEILNLLSTYIFVNIFLILILRVRERSCSRRQLHVRRQLVSWCSKCTLPTAMRCISLIGRG